jgi:hypothetical protein
LIIGLAFGLTNALQVEKPWTPPNIGPGIALTQSDLN